VRSRSYAAPAKKEWQDALTTYCIEITTTVSTTAEFAYAVLSDGERQIQPYVSC
jgi:hypothetical protein